MKRARSVHQVTEEGEKIMRTGRSIWIGTILVMLLGIVLVLAACGGDTTTTGATETTAADTTTTGAPTTEPPASTEPIKIGVVVSQSGTAAAPASAVVAATKVEAEYINANGGVNGRMIELIMEDDKSDVSAAVAAMTKLIEQDKVSAIIGPFPQYVEDAARPVAENAGIPTVMYIPPSIKSLADTSFVWTFLATAGPDALAEAELLLLQAEGYKKIVAVADNLSIHQETLELLKEPVKAAGIEMIVLPDTWTLAESDLGPITAKIAAAVKDAKPDAILLLSNPLHAPGLQKGLRALGVEQQIVGSPAATSGAMFMQGPELAEGMTMIGTGTVNAYALPDDTPGKAEMVAFSDRFAAAGGPPADFYAGFGHDALHLVVNAMIAAGGDDKQAVRDAIEATTEWQGMQGIFRYSSTDHVGIHGGLFQWRIKGGTFEFVRALNPEK